MAVDLILIGILVAFVACGYSLVYGVLRFVNVAHGDMLALTALVVWQIQRVFDFHSPTLLFLAGGVVGVAYSVAVAYFLFLPLRRFGGKLLLVVSFGISILVQGLMALLWGGRSRMLSVDESAVSIFGRSTTQWQAGSCLAFLVILALVVYFLYLTYPGLVFRGYAQSSTRIATLGIRVELIALGAFALSGFLAGVASIAIALAGGASSQMGFRFSLWAFAATIAGGLGSMKGTIIAGLLLGAFLSLATRYGSAVLTDLLAFGTVMIYLLIRPEKIRFEERKF